VAAGVQGTLCNSGNNHPLKYEEQVRHITKVSSILFAQTPSVSRGHRFSPDLSVSTSVHHEDFFKRALRSGIIQQMDRQRRATSTLRSSLSIK
jgi:hypothetical protein